MRVETFGAATIYLADCREVLPSLRRVDHVITDPPYEAEAHGEGRRLLGRKADAPAGDEVRVIDPAALDFAPLDEALRSVVCSWAGAACDGWFLAFCQAEAVAVWRAAMEGGGARWRRAQVWIKPDSSPQLSGDRPAQGYESIATAWCGPGRSVWGGGGKRGVYVHGKHDVGQGHGGGRNVHPTQKPIALMAELLHLFTAPGALVADPFMGSGTTGVAALACGRRFVGIERSPRYFDMACARLRAAAAQGVLFPAYGLPGSVHVQTELV